MRYIKTKFTDFLFEYYNQNQYDENDRLHQKLINYYKNNTIIDDFYLVKDEKLLWLYKQIISMIDEMKEYNITSDDYLNIDNWGIKPNGNLGLFDIGFGNYFEEFEKEPDIIKLNESSMYKEIIDENIHKIKNKLNISYLSYIDSGFFGNAYNIGNNEILKITGDKSEAINCYKIINKKLNHIVNVYDVKQFEIDNKIFYSIIEEKLEINNILKEQYKKLEKIFDDLVNKHIDINIIDKIRIKHPIVADFLTDMISIGYEKTWEKYNKVFNKKRYLLDKYDFNDISEISNWIKNSVTNKNFIVDEPPQYIYDIIKTLI